MRLFIKIKKKNMGSLFHCLSIKNIYHIPVIMRPFEAKNSMNLHTHVDD